MDAIQRLARRERLTVGEWVRRALRDARETLPAADAPSKLKTVRRAAGHAFPSGDIGRMLDEIERGYQA